VLLALALAAFPAPVGPGAGQPAEHLARGGLAAAALGLGQQRQPRLVGIAAPQPGRHPLSLDRGEPRRDAGLAQIFLGEDVAGDLAPLGRDLDSLGGEDDRSIGVADLAGGTAEGDGLIRITAGRGKTTRDMHGLRFPRFAAGFRTPHSVVQAMLNPIYSIVKWTISPCGVNAPCSAQYVAFL